MFILTIRNDGLGDLVLSLPTISALHRQYPQARLGALVHPGQVPLFELYDVPVDVWPDLPATKARLRKDRPDVMLFLSPDPRWALAGFLARVPRRVGTRHRAWSVFFNEKADVRRRGGGHHEAEYNLMVASSLQVGLPLVPLRLTVPGAYRVEAARARAQSGIRSGAPYVVLHPGSRGSAPNWPPTRYAELCRALSVRGMQVLVTGGATESELCREVAGSHGCRAGVTALGLLAAHLSDAVLLVAGSTGPLHMAAALGTRVVGLYSSSPPQSPVRWGPLGPGHIVLQSEPFLPASGEAHLGQVQVTEVLQAVDRLLAVPRSAL